MIDADTLRELFNLKLTAAEEGMRLPVRRIAKVGLVPIRDEDMLGDFLSMTPESLMAARQKHGDVKFRRYLKHVKTTAVNNKLMSEKDAQELIENYLPKDEV